jgi:hypothetical protein
MKLLTVTIGALTALAFTASVAAAQMQPIPNPPEKPKAAHHHHKKKKAAEPAAASSDKPADKMAADKKK